MYYKGPLSDIPLAKVFFVAWSAYLKKQNWKHEHKYMKKNDFTNRMIFKSKCKWECPQTMFMKILIISMEV